MMKAVAWRAFRTFAPVNLSVAVHALNIAVPLSWRIGMVHTDRGADKSRFASVNKKSNADKHPLKALPSNNRGEYFFFFSSRRRHTRFDCDWSSDVCSSD